MIPFDAALASPDFASRLSLPWYFQLVAAAGAACRRTATRTPTRTKMKRRIRLPSVFRDLPAPAGGETLRRLGRERLEDAENGEERSGRGGQPERRQAPAHGEHHEQGAGRRKLHEVELARHA